MRSTRALAPILVIGFIALVVLVIATRSDGGVKQQPVVRALSVEKIVTKYEQQQLRQLAHSISTLQTSTWRCQDILDVPRTKRSWAPWALPRGVAYRSQVSAMWKGYEARCVSRLSDRTIPGTGDWQTAVKFVQRIFPGTERWLLSCSRGEGGHGGFVMNHQGSGAGGWMQFMSSTFYAHYKQAFTVARARGFFLDREYESWYHPIGQAVTAAYMRTHGMSGHWDPRIDYLCA